MIKLEEAHPAPPKLYPVAGRILFPSCDVTARQPLAVASRGRVWVQDPNGQWQESAMSGAFRVREFIIIDGHEEEVSISSFRIHTREHVAYPPIHFRDLRDWVTANYIVVRDIEDVSMMVVPDFAGTLSFGFEGDYLTDLYDVKLAGFKASSLGAINSANHHHGSENEVAGLREAIEALPNRDRLAGLPADIRLFIEQELAMLEGP